MTSINIVRQLCDRCLPCSCSLTVDQEQQILKDLNVVRIIKEDTDLISYIKDYYENMWSDIHDENDMKFMKYWSNEAYKNRYHQNK